MKINNLNGVCVCVFDVVARVREHRPSIPGFFWTGYSSPGRARSPVFDGTRSWAGSWPWQDPEGRGYWSVDRSVRIFVR